MIAAMNGFVKSLPLPILLFPLLPYMESSHRQSKNKSYQGFYEYSETSSTRLAGSLDSLLHQ